MRNWLGGFVAAALAAGAAFGAQNLETANCNQSTAPFLYFDLPGHPFGAVPTPDGCWIFVSMAPAERGSQSGVGVIKRTAGKLSLVRFLRDDDAPLGMVLTHDGKLLVVANGSNVVFLDVERSIS